MTLEGSQQSVCVCTVLVVCQTLQICAVLFDRVEVLLVRVSIFCVTELIPFAVRHRVRCYDTDARVKLF